MTEAPKNACNENPTKSCLSAANLSYNKQAK